MGRKRQQVVARVRSEISRSLQWQQTVGNNWICPFCGNLVKIPKKTAEDARVELVSDHLMEACPGWQGFRGMTLPVKVLKGKRLSLLIDYKLGSDPVWQCFDEAGHWHCPFSMQRVTMPSADKREIREAIKEHLKHNHNFNHGKGKTQSMEKMQAAVDRANSIARLLPRVTEVLNSDQRWQDRALDGSWVCPFCQDRIKNIDISTEILRRETAPKKIAEHLMMYCKVFQKVQVRGKDGDLRPPDNLVRITNFIVDRRERKERETAAKLGRSSTPQEQKRQITAELLAGAEPVQKGPGHDEITKKRKKKKRKPATSTEEHRAQQTRGFSADKGTRALDESALLDPNATGNMSGISLSADGFALSLNMEEEATTWDAINDPRAQRVNSAEEGRTVPAPNDDPTPPPMPAVGAAPAAAAEPATAPPAPEAPSVPTPAPAPAPDAADMEDERTRIVQQALTRARRSLMEMIGPIPRVSGYEFGAVFRPSPALDGDFFQYFDLGGGRYAISSWEVSETGMDMVPINRHFLELLRRLVMSKKEPREVLLALNAEMFESTSSEIYVSVLLGFLDTTTHTLQLCSAGFEPLALYNQFRKPPLDEIGCNGIVLGSDEGSLFSTLLEQRTIELQPQDLMVAYSQGVGGFDDTEGNPVDIERFKTLICEHGRQDASYFLSMTDAEYKRLRGGGPTSRDLTILAIKRL